MKFKKFTTIAATAAIVAAAALSGCGGSNSGSASASGSADSASAADAVTEVADTVDGAEDAAPAEAPGDSGFAEIEIGENDVEEAHIHVGAVYFQAVDMLPAKQLSADEADIHLEADISALDDDYYGFGAGAFVPYLTVDYTVTDEAGAVVAEGSFMPMNADDGPHYGNNIKMPGEGQYKLGLKIAASEDYLLHSDEETGVEAGKNGESLWTTPVELEFDWDYVPVK